MDVRKNKYGIFNILFSCYRENLVKNWVPCVTLRFCHFRGLCKINVLSLINNIIDMSLSTNEHARTLTVITKFLFKFEG